MFGERKYFLDWLRVAAFGFLILYHVGLLYVDWGYNITSDRIFPLLEYLMISVSPWRLVLLFFISGVASRFLLEKLSPGKFSMDRLRRLFVVLMLGTVVINSTQAYVELLNKGLIEPGFLDFWFYSYLPGKQFPGRVVPSWDHLWFLVYLLFYTMGLALLFKIFRPRKTIYIPLILLIIFPGLWLCFTNVLIQEFSPVTMDLFNDWGNHLRWIGVFTAGVICAGRGAFWEFVKESRKKLLVFSLIGLGFQMGNGILWRAGLVDPLWDGIIYGLIQGIYGWVVVLTLTGYACQYLNRQTDLLRYLNDAVLPVYVLHQPILLVSAYLLLPYSLPAFIEILLIVLITGAGSFAIFEILVRRWRISRFLFGLKIMAPGRDVIKVSI